jgi:hypothetical protein
MELNIPWQHTTTGREGTPCSRDRRGWCRTAGMAPRGVAIWTFSQFVVSLSVNTPVSYLTITAKLATLDG